MSFFNEIKNQFGKIIKILRSDNTKEYFFMQRFLHSYFFPGNFTSVNMSSHSTTKRYTREEK